MMAPLRLTDRAIMILLVALLTAVHFAAATPTPTPEAAGTDSPARRAFEQGRRDYNLGRFPEAVAAFEESYRLSGDPVLLFNLAQSHRRAGQRQKALNAYQAYLRELPGAPNRALAEAKIAELQAGSQDDRSSVPPPGPGSPADISDPYVNRMAARPPIETTTVAATHPFGTSGLPRWLPWAGVAATAGLFAGALAATVSVRTRRGELQDTCAPPRGSGCADGDVDALESRHNLRNVLWVATGAAAAATGMGFYLALAPRQVELALKVRF
jgi:tetratricopeptide (TPR) repeat protein